MRADGDAAACVDALRDVQLASGYPTRWPDDPAAWLDPPDLVGAWVAEREDRIVGHIGLAAGRSEPGLAAATGVPVELLVLVTRLFVTPAARGLGLARALLSVVTGHAAATDLTLGLDVIERSVEAIALYESLGWRHVGSARARWRTQDGRHPMVRYYLAPEG
ncbi:MAG TPA: GNAT family N-acetyltransferase [Jatrophihabitans sp.]|jgi:GNAT superfamily N-acetyltransferase|uniref:GNAT family N-acetyltransferase n=1 Tax=Jatrophihabitans sp. TaxID=1932789 RepID=UPI002DFD93D1|nr:GNAT family N-acetyltransferase [Jatrophihabitans sp.]